MDRRLEDFVKNKNSNRSRVCLCPKALLYGDVEYLSLEIGMSLLFPEIVMHQMMAKGLASNFKYLCLHLTNSQGLLRNITIKSGAHLNASQNGLKCPSEYTTKELMLKKVHFSLLLWNNNLIVSVGFVKDNDPSESPEFLKVFSHSKWCYGKGTEHKFLK